LAPALAVGRATDAAAAKGADRAAAYDARVAGYVHAAGAAAAAAPRWGQTTHTQSTQFKGESSGVTRRAASTDHVPSMRLTTGNLRVTLVSGGSNSGAYSKPEP